MRNDGADLGTPSAPPIIETGIEGNSEAETEPREDSGALTDTDRSIDGKRTYKESTDHFNVKRYVSSNWQVESPKDERVQRFH